MTVTLFNGTAVSSANWVFETGGGGWGNNEKQCYQAANATVANGELGRVASQKYKSRGCPPGGPCFLRLFLAGLRLA